MSKKVNPFDAFSVSTETKTAKIESLNGAEITYRELTMGEDDKFRRMMIKGIDKDGSPIMNLDKYEEVKYHKVATMLIEPTMTVEALKNLSTKAEGAIEEILKLVKDNDEEADEKN